MTAATGRARSLAPVLLASLISGVLAVLCFPGWNHGQLAWIALVPLLLRPSVAAFPRGFLTGFAASLGTLYWIYPTCRAAAVHPAAAVLATASLSAYCALYWGAFTAGAGRLARLPAAARPFAWAALWVALEFLRARVLSGFPWLPLAHSQWNVPQHLPLAEVGGEAIVSFMLVLFNGGLAVAGEALLDRRPRAAAAALPAALALIGLVAASVALSKRRALPAGPLVELAVVQGNIDQYKKWDGAYEQEIAAVYDRLTREALPADLVIWPETSVPGWLPNDPRWLRWVTGLSSATQTPLLIGAVTRDGGDYNAAFLVHPSSGVAQRYRKRHLVPFGETVPFQSILGRWVPVLGELGRFDASNDWTVFRSTAAGGAASFAVNICFESLFPGIVRGFIRRGAGFTVNMTNDGWFLDTAAAEQHFAAAPFRAVENRSWVVCAANTGVTALVDPDGRVAARLPRLAPGVLKGRVMAGAGGTFYTRHGDLFAGACLLAAALSLTLSRRAATIRP